MEKFRLSVSVTGVKKKCRKPDRHLFNMGYMEYNPNMTDEQKQEVVQKAKDLLAVNMKSFLNGFTVNLNHVTLRDELEMWEPFAETNLKIKVG
jgi:hypothetical protein